MSDSIGNPLDDPTADPFEVAAAAAEDIARITGVERHDIALTLGSGWGKAAELLGETTATFPATQVTGLEAAQGRKEEAVTRHCRLRGVAPSLLQRTPASGAETARLAFAQGEQTVGQRIRTIARDALHGLLRLIEHLLAQGRSCEHILEVLMPA